MKHKICYTWKYQNGKAADLLKLIRPYLIVKQEQADIGMELINNWAYTKGGRGAKTPPLEVARREALWLRMRSLNQTGDTAATTKSSGPHVKSVG